jgi:hypothetical protein
MRSARIWVAMALWSLALPAGAMMVTSTNTIDFGAQPLGIPSARFAFTVINDFSLAQPVFVQINYTQSGLCSTHGICTEQPYGWNTDFTVTSDCPSYPSTLPAGGRCTAWVVFTPSAAGPRMSEVWVEYRQFVALSGVGVGLPVPAINPWMLVLLAVLLVATRSRFRT